MIFHLFFSPQTGPALAFAKFGGPLTVDNYSCNILGQARRLVWKWGGGGGYFEVADLGFQDWGAGAIQDFGNGGGGHGLGFWKVGPGELALDCGKNCSDLSLI